MSEPEDTLFFRKVDLVRKRVVLAAQEVPEKACVVVEEEGK